MKICITGHCGFIGFHLWDRLREDHEIIGIDLKKGKDILDMKPEDLEGVEYLFHLAARVSVSESIENPEETHNNNVTGTYHVLECARLAGVKRVIFSSSSAVYGINENHDKLGIPYNELMALEPVSPYGLSKLIGEEYCKLYSRIYGIDTVCLRYFNVYGDRMKSDSPYSAAIAIFLDKKSKNKPLPVLGGKQTRDFVHVDDVVEANIKAMKYERIFDGQPINIGTGRDYSIEDIAKIISSNIEYFPQREHEANSSLAYIHTANRVLHWRAKYNILEWLKHV